VPTQGSRGEKAKSPSTKDEEQEAPSQKIRTKKKKGGRIAVYLCERDLKGCISLCKLSNSFTLLTVSSVLARKGVSYVECFKLYVPAIDNKRTVLDSAAACYIEVEEYLVKQGWGRA
jgi:hypothetical protein